MNNSSTPYQRISCGLYDQIEIYAMRKTPVQLEVNLAGNKQTLTGIITDVQALKEGEFLTMESGEVIRLDHLISLEAQ